MSDTGRACKVAVHACLGGGGVVTHSPAEVRVAVGWRARALELDLGIRDRDHIVIEEREDRLRRSVRWPHVIDQLIVWLSVLGAWLWRARRCKQAVEPDVVRPCMVTYVHDRKQGAVANHCVRGIPNHGPEIPFHLLRLCPVLRLHRSAVLPPGRRPRLPLEEVCCWHEC